MSRRLVAANSKYSGDHPSLLAGFATLKSEKPCALPPRTIGPVPAFLRWFLDLWATNPIVVRLVQNGSKRLRHLYIRTGYLALLSIALLWTLLVTAGGGTLSYVELAAAGARGFEFLAYLQVALICILTPVFMAGAIAHEADPRTWSILLTTPLSAVQIVLGNLLGRLFFVLALLFASLPLFAVTQYFGGAPASSIFASYAVAACATLLVGGVAIALSVLRLGGRRAVFGFYVGVIACLGATWGVDRLIQQSTGAGVTWLTPLNPFLALESLLSPSAYPKPAPVDLAAMSTLGRLWFGSPVLSWCLLSGGLALVLTLLSAFAVRAVPAIEGTTARSGRLLRLRGRQRPARTVWHNPVAWREGAARTGFGVRRIGRWLFVAASALWAIFMLIQHNNGVWDIDTFRFALRTTVIAELAIAALLAIQLAATSVSREREDGTLDLLLTTPLTPRMYLGGKLRGIIAAITPFLAAPLGTLALAGLYTLIGGLGGTSASALVKTVSFQNGASVDVPMVLPEAALVGPLVAAPFLGFCVIVGLQWSVRSKGTIGSVVATVAMLGVIAGVVGLCAWQLGSNIELVGPAVAMATPATAIEMLINADSAAFQTLDSDAGLAGLRLAIVFGAVVVAGAYTLIVYSILSSMVRTFDVTVRRLAGAR